jgi:hypothetical protein
MRLLFSFSILLRNNMRNRMIVKSIRLIFLFLSSSLLLETTLKADHLPENLLAAGQPEVVLAGIKIRTSTLDDVIRLYGNPTRKEESNDWIGCTWNLLNAKLKVNLYHKSLKTQITDIYIEGTATGELGSTGRGLKLGDNFEVLTNIYGKRYLLTNLSEDSNTKREVSSEIIFANKGVTIQWKSEEFTLTVKLDIHGKIYSMWLILPECYESPCE